jgi:hypothetical protein
MTAQFFDATSRCKSLLVQFLRIPSGFLAFTFHLIVERSVARIGSIAPNPISDAVRGAQRHVGKQGS